MNIQYSKPGPLLQSYVIQYIYLHVTADAFTHFQMVPRTCPGLILTSPDCGEFNNLIGKEYFPLSVGRVYYGGLGCLPAEMQISNKVQCIVAMLQPYCAGMFLKEDANHFVDRIEDLTGHHSRFHELSMRIWEKDLSISQRIGILENFLIEKLTPYDICPYAYRATHYINQSKGLENVKNVAGNAFTCERNLQRQFKQHLGFSPKQYSSMVRFSSFLKEFLLNPSVPLADIAFRHNYYDVSHLSKDSIKYLGNKLSICYQQDQRINKAIL